MRTATVSFTRATMTRPLRRALVLCWALAVAFGPAASLQIAGWATMNATRSVDRGMVAAVGSTLSGREPCRLCTVAGSLRDDAGPARGRGDASPMPVRKKLSGDGVPPVAFLPVVESPLGDLPETPRRLAGGASWRPQPALPPPRQV